MSQKHLKEKFPVFAKVEIRSTSLAQCQCLTVSVLPIKHRDFEFEGQLEVGEGEKGARCQQRYRPADTSPNY